MALRKPPITPPPSLFEDIVFLTPSEDSLALITSLQQLYPTVATIKRVQADPAASEDTGAAADPGEEFDAETSSKDRAEAGKRSEADGNSEADAAATANTGALATESPEDRIEEIEDIQDAVQNGQPDAEVSPDGSDPARPGEATVEWFDPATLVKNLLSGTAATNDRSAADQANAERSPMLSGFAVRKDRSVADQVEAARRRIVDRDSGNKKQLLAMYDSGSRRRLATISHEKLARLDELEALFPNFSAPLKMIRRLLALPLGKDAEPAVHFKPILMVGPPGVGKTLFARHLAAALQTPFEQIDLGSTGGAHALCGSDVHWYNTQPGRIVQILTQHPVANPLILLDEVDKASSEQRSYPVLPALLSLLEPNSAQYFQDSHIPGVTVNAAHILWLGSANRIDDLRPEIVNRFERCHIPRLTNEQMRGLAQREYLRLRQHWRLVEKLPEPLSEPVLDLIMGLETRPLLRFLEYLLGELVSRRTQVVTTDIVRQLLDELGGPRDPVEPRPIGFLH